MLRSTFSQLFAWQSVSPSYTFGLEAYFAILAKQKQARDDSYLRSSVSTCLFPPQHNLFRELLVWKKRRWDVKVARINERFHEKQRLKTSNTIDQHGQRQRSGAKYCQNSNNKNKNQAAVGFQQCCVKSAQIAKTEDVESSDDEWDDITNSWVTKPHKVKLTPLQLRESAGEVITQEQFIDEKLRIIEARLNDRRTTLKQKQDLCEDRRFWRGKKNLLPLWASLAAARSAATQNMVQSMDNGDKNVGVKQLQLNSLVGNSGRAGAPACTSVGTQSNKTFKDMLPANDVTVATSLSPSLPMPSTTSAYRTYQPYKPQVPVSASNSSNGFKPNCFNSINPLIVRTPSKGVVSKR